MSGFDSVLNKAFDKKGSVFAGSPPAGADRGMATNCANPTVDYLVSKNFSGGKYTRKADNVRRIVPAVSRGRALALGLE